MKYLVLSFLLLASCTKSPGYVYAPHMGATLAKCEDVFLRNAGIVGDNCQSMNCSGQISTIKYDMVTPNGQAFDTNPCEVE